jgi:hypothetical protein
MIDLKLLSHSLNSTIDEVSALVTHQNPWASNIVITCSNRKCVFVSALQSFTGVSSAHLVKYYVLVMIYLAPNLLAGGLIGPTKFIAHFLNTCKVTCCLRGILSRLLGFPTLWHTSHLWN